MNLGRSTRFLLAAPVLFVLSICAMAGCGDFWQAPNTSSSTCTTNCSTASSGDFYMLNDASTPQIIGESIASGAITTISGSPWTLEGVPYAMAIAPNGKFLCVSTLEGVFSYPISSGSLQTAVVASQDAVAEAIQVDRTDSWLVEAVPGTDSVELAAVPIDSQTGASAGAEIVSSPIAVMGAAVHQMVISPDDRYVFVALGAGGTLVVPFNAGAASGTSPFESGGITISAVNSGGSDVSVAVDPSSTPRLFYIGETLASPSGASGGLRAFSYSSLSNSKLTQATGSPIASGGLAPNFILPISSGDYVYVANGTGGNAAGSVAAFAVTESAGAYSISAGPTASAGAGPAGLAEDSSGTYVMEIGSGSPYFDAYTFDTTTAGKLDSQLTSNAAANFTAIVATP